MLSLENITTEIHTLVDPDLWDADKEIAKLAKMLIEMENIIKSRLRTKFSVLEEFFLEAEKTVKEIREIGVDASVIENRIEVLHKAYVKVRKSVAKETEKTAKQPRKKGRKKIKTPKSPKNKKTSEIKEKIIEEVQHDLPAHTIIDAKPDLEVKIEKPIIEEIPFENEIENESESDINTEVEHDTNSEISIWPILRDKILNSIRKGFRYTGEKISRSWRYTGEKISSGYKHVAAATVRGYKFIAEKSSNVFITAKDRIAPKYRKIAEQSSRGYKKTTEKIALGYKYTTEKFSKSWTWLQSRSPDQILFGARTTWGFSASIFAFLTAIGLSVGWTAPNLGIIFFISAGLFMGSELIRLTMKAIAKYRPKEVI